MVYNKELGTVRGVCFGRAKSNADYPQFDATTIYQGFEVWLRTFSGSSNYPMLLPYVLMDIELMNTSIYGSYQMGKVYSLEEDSGYYSWGDDHNRPAENLDYGEVIKKLSKISSSCVELEVRGNALLRVTKDMKEACKWLSDNAVSLETPQASNRIKEASLNLIERISVKAAQCQQTIDTARMAARKAEILLGVVRMIFLFLVTFTDR